jgi:tetratricopeptide (TPR) repeat protein
VDPAALREVLASPNQARQPGLCTLLQPANVLYALDRKPEAAERLYQAAELEPQEPAACYNLGKVLAKLKRFQEAKTAFEAAVDLGYPDAHYDLADLLSELGAHEEARWHC